MKKNDIALTAFGKRWFRGGDRRSLILCSLSVCCAIFFFFCCGVQYCFDSSSYIDAWDYFSVGRIDVCRTPVYPVFLGVLKTLFGQRFDLAAVCIQYLVYLLSIRSFYQILSAYNIPKSVGFWLTLIYLCPMVWCSFIYTESLAVSGTVFLLQSALLLYRKCSFARGAIFALVLLLLVFFRPAFIYLLPMLFVWWILAAVAKKQKRSAGYGLAAVATVCILMLAYMKTYEKAYGIFSMTNVGVINQVAVVVRHNFLDLEEIEQDAVRPYFEQAVENQGLGFDLGIEGNTLNGIQTELNALYRRHAVQYLRSIFGRLCASSGETLFFVNLYTIGALFDLFSPRASSLYLLLVFYTILLIRSVMKRRSLSMSLSILLYMWIIAHIATAIIGSDKDFGRLFLPVLPIWVLMLGQVCTMFGKARSADDVLQE